MVSNKIEMMLYTVMILQVITMFDGDPRWVAGGVAGIAMFFEVFYPWLYGEKKILKDKTTTTAVTTKAQSHQGGS